LEIRAGPAEPPAPVAIRYTDRKCIAAIASAETIHMSCIVNAIIKIHSLTEEFDESDYHDLSATLSNYIASMKWGEVIGGSIPGANSAGSIQFDLACPDSQWLASLHDIIDFLRVLEVPRDTQVWYEVFGREHLIDVYDA
jgi:hypothetical protein